MTPSIVIMEIPLPIRIKDGNEIVEGFLIYVEKVDDKVRYAVQCSDGVLRYFNNCDIDED